MMPAANDNWTAAQAEAVEEIYDAFDLIATKPHPFEIAWELERRGLI